MGQKVRQVGMTGEVGIDFALNVPEAHRTAVRSAASLTSRFVSI
jgi:hypothetical protein